MPFTDAELEKIFRLARLNDGRDDTRLLLAATTHFTKLINGLLPESREKSLAITSLQQTMHWSYAALAIHGPVKLAPCPDKQD